MAYNELIKSFGRIRNYMREFFVYGFKSRDEYASKSARSYDNERRRVESWLGEAMSFRQAENGKNVFISVDSREMVHNPLFRAFKAKSFTDRDIALYFHAMDILTAVAGAVGDGAPASDGASAGGLSAPELHDAIAERCRQSMQPDTDFDLSTLRKKLKEFEELGLICSRKFGNRVLYAVQASPEPDEALAELGDAVAFFTEEAPLGVIGSYIAERSALQGAPDGGVRMPHKHHYILDVLDSEIMTELLRTMRERRFAEVHAVSRSGRDHVWKLIPLKLFVSTQQGRFYLIAYSPKSGSFDSVRTDQIHRVVIGGIYPEYDAVQARFQDFRRHLWGVAFRRPGGTVHIEMDLRVEAHEEFIVRRLKREARCGIVRPIAPDCWRFEADVYDTQEMLPWIRSFTGRILRLASSDGAAEERFYEDLRAMKRMYEEEGGAGDAVS